MTDLATLDTSRLRFIAMDMDGTILDGKYRLSPLVVQTLNRLQRRGKKLIIATGRIYASAQGFLRDAFEPDAFVCTNGADIYGPGGERIAVHPIPRQALSALAAAGRHHASHELLFCCYVGDQWIYEQPSAMVDFYEQRSGIKGLRQSFDSLAGEDILKFLAIGPHETLLHIRDEIAESAEGLLETAFSHETMLEIMASGVSKCRGLEECLRSLGGSLEETIAFGDEENDLEMLKAVKVGVAMGNAHASIQAGVPFVTDSVDEDGVARFLERLFGL
jgi:Cof subfamily protein (haloacid dehalogenase superfamily)